MRKLSVLIISLLLAACLLAGCASGPKAPKAPAVQLSEAEARAAINFAMGEVKVPAKVMDYFPILTQTDTVNISWTSSNPKVMWFDFKFIEVRPAPEDTVVTLTATFECSGITVEKSYDVLVYGEETFLTDAMIEEMLFEVTVADFEFGDSYMNLGERCRFWDPREWENRAVRINFNPHYRIDDTEHFRVYDHGEVWVDSHSITEDYKATLSVVYQIDVRDHRTGEEHSFTTKTKKVELCAPKLTHFDTPDWSMDVIGDTFVFQEHRDDMGEWRTRGAIYRFTIEDGIIITTDVAARENENEEWFYFSDSREYAKQQVVGLLDRYQQLYKEIPGMEKIDPEEGLDWYRELNGTMQEQGFGDFNGDFFVNETDMAIFLGMDPLEAEDWGRAYDFIMDTGTKDSEFFKLQMIWFLDDWRSNMAAFLGLEQESPMDAFYARLPDFVEEMSAKMYAPRRFTYRAWAWYDDHECCRYAEIYFNELWNESIANWWEQNGEWRWSGNDWDGDVWRVESWGVCHETHNEDGSNWREDRWDGCYNEDRTAFVCENGDVFPLSFNPAKRTLTAQLPDGTHELNFQGYGLF